MASYHRQCHCPGCIIGHKYHQVWKKAHQDCLQEREIRTRNNDKKPNTPGKKSAVIGAEQLGFLSRLEKFCCYSLLPFPEGFVAPEEIFPGLITIAWLSLSSFNATFWKPVWSRKKCALKHTKNYTMLLMTKAKSGERFLQANKISGISRSARIYAMAIPHLLQRLMCVCLSYSSYFCSETLSLQQVLHLPRYIRRALGLFSSQYLSKFFINKPQSRTVFFLSPACFPKPVCHEQEKNRNRQVETSTNVYSIVIGWAPIFS